MLEKLETIHEVLLKVSESKHEPLDIPLALELIEELLEEVEQRETKVYSVELVE